MEEWRVIADFPDYAVSSEGRIKRIVPDFRGRVGNIVKPHLDRYAMVTLYENRKARLTSVHKLVCLAFHGLRPTPLHEVAHGDGNGHNNRKDNLRWATKIENEADKITHGTSLAGKPSHVALEKRPRGATHGRRTKPEKTARGERVSTAKLTEEKVIAIRVDSRPRKEIAASYGITVTMVGYIQRGKSWTHVVAPTIGE